MRVALALAALVVSASAGLAGQCGPDKLRTARVAEVGTHGGLFVGLKTYPQTIPLADHEVILTFDDGPTAEFTPKILDALKDQCVHATFFEIGRNAAAFPALARREVAEGHTVAHHTWSHPQPTMRYIPEATAKTDILRGMIAVEKAAYGQTFPSGEPTDLKDLKLHAPFFRFPGFADTPALRDWLSANNVGVFGVDLWASDWVAQTPEAELKLVMSRLDKNGHRGMLLLHDSHPWTAAMVPMLLARLKADGYSVVHMVPGPGTGPTAPSPPGWTSETERVLAGLKPKLGKQAAHGLKHPTAVKSTPRG